MRGGAGRPAGWSRPGEPDAGRLRDVRLHGGDEQRQGNARDPSAPAPRLRRGVLRCPHARPSGSSSRPSGSWLPQRTRRLPSRTGISCLFQCCVRQVPCITASSPSEGLSVLSSLMTKWSRIAACQGHRTFVWQVWALLTASGRVGRGPANGHHTQADGSRVGGATRTSSPERLMKTRMYPRARSAASSTAADLGVGGVVAGADLVPDSGLPPGPVIGQRRVRRRWWARGPLRVRRTTRPHRPCRYACPAMPTRPSRFTAARALLRWLDERVTWRATRGAPSPF